LIPGLRDIPRVIPVYRLIWPDWYRSSRTAAPEQPTESEPAPHQV
jgi:hypothetical protein